MPRQSSSTRRRSNPATVFGNLIPACHLLDDWLVWMEDACGQRIGAGGLAALPFLHRTPSLPSIGNSFGPDGDDGTLFRVCRFLVEVAPRIEEDVRRWGPPFTIEGPVYSGRLLSIEYDPTGQPSGWSSASLQAVLSAPTAHEAVLEWLKRFCSLVGERFPNFTVRPQMDVTPSLLAEELPAFFQRLEWNCRFATDLLAGMEQERRRLHATVGQTLSENGEPTNSYGSLWRPAVRPWALTEQDVRHLSVKAVRILRELHRAEPLRKDDLNRQTTRGPVSGGFNNALRDLMNRRLVQSGGRGKNSRGYSLTALGLQAVHLVARHK